MLHSAIHSLHWLGRRATTRRTGVAAHQRPQPAKSGVKNHCWGTAGHRGGGGRVLQVEPTARVQRAQPRQVRHPWRQPKCVPAVKKTGGRT